MTRYNFAPHTVITIDRDGKTTVQRSVWETENMTLYEDVEPEAPPRPWLWRLLAWSSAFAWLAVLIWFDRYA